MPTPRSGQLSGPLIVTVRLVEVIRLSRASDICRSMSYDPATIALLRRTLDEVLRDSRFYGRKSASALEVAEHLLAQAAAGERDLDRLKSSAFKKLMGTTERFPDQAA